MAAPVVIDLGEVQDVTQDREQRVAAVQNRLRQLPGAPKEHVGIDNYLLPRPSRNYYKHHFKVPQQLNV